MIRLSTNLQSRLVCSSALPSPSAMRANIALYRPKGHRASWHLVHSSKESRFHAGPRGICNAQSPHTVYFSEASSPKPQSRRSLLGWWLGLGTIWTTYWVGYGMLKQETVPITGRRRYAGSTAQNELFLRANDRPCDELTWQERHDLQVISVPEDDPSYLRVKIVFDRLLASSGLRSSSWKLVVTKMQGE